MICINNNRCITFSFLKFDIYNTFNVHVIHNCVYSQRNKKLTMLKKKAMMRNGDLIEDSRSSLPFPNTTSREVYYSTLVIIYKKLKSTKVL